MTTLSAYITFYYFYFLYYAAPFIIGYVLCQLFGLNIDAILKSLGDFKPIIGFIGILLLFVLPVYRTKLAVAAYGERDIKFWEAHSVSGAILRANLSFLPIIGFLFEVKDNK